MKKYFSLDPIHGPSPDAGSPVMVVRDDGNGRTMGVGLLYSEGIWRVESGFPGLSLADVLTKDELAFFDAVCRTNDDEG